MGWCSTYDQSTGKGKGRVGKGGWGGVVLGRVM